MADIALLVCGVTCALIAAGAALFAIPYFFEDPEDDPEWRQEYKKVGLIASIMFIFTSAALFLDFRYLLAYNPSILVVFASWYAVGFLSRLFLLVWRHDFLSPVFATNDLEILPLFFYAVGGPIVIFFAIKEIIRCRGNPFHDIDKLH